MSTRTPPGKNFVNADQPSISPKTSTQASGFAIITTASKFVPPQEQESLSTVSQQFVPPQEQESLSTVSQLVLSETAEAEAFTHT
jgi:hypothetical protein